MCTQNIYDSIIQQIAASTGMKPGWIDDARRAATPYVVDWGGLTREDLGDAMFEERLWAAPTGATSGARTTTRSSRSGTRAG